MAFDPSTAVPVSDAPAKGGFDPSTARPMMQAADTEAPGPWPPPEKITPAPDGALSHIGSAIGGAFKGPYGPQEPLLNPKTAGDGPVTSGINTAFHAGGAAVDAIGRPVRAAIRGGAAGVSEIARALGLDDTQAAKLERDLNLGGDVTATLAAAVPGAAVGGVPSAPKVPKPMTASELLRNEGVRLTPGQMMGGMARATENKATSIPLTGDAIISAQRRSIEDFNRAGYNRALAPIGEKYTGNATGYEGIKQVGDKLSGAYNKVLSKVNFTRDADFDADLGAIQESVKEMPPDQAGQFNAILENRVTKRLEPDGTMTGEKFKDVESELTNKASGFHRSDDQAVRELGDAVDELNGALRANLARTNPEYAEDINAANRGWAMFARLRRAAANRSTSGGVFTPGDLLSAAKMGDSRPGRGGFAQGEALLQDLGWAGQQVLPNTYPESGTAGRMLLATGALGASELLGRPGLMAALGGGMIPYTKPAISLLNKAVPVGPGPRVAPTARALGYGLPGIGVRRETETAP